MILSGPVAADLRRTSCRCVEWGASLDCQTVRSVERRPWGFVPKKSLVVAQIRILLAVAGGLVDR